MLPSPHTLLPPVLRTTLFLAAASIVDRRFGVGAETSQARGMVRRQRAETDGSVDDGQHSREDDIAIDEQTDGVQVDQPAGEIPSASGAASDDKTRQVDDGDEGDTKAIAKAKEMVADFLPEKNAAPADQINASSVEEKANIGENTLDVPISQIEEADVVTGTSAGPDLWTTLGCYPRLPADDAEPGDVAAARDLECANSSVSIGQPCRSGLPFFRMVANELSPGVCKDYCLGKGLDICGLVGNKECRCGASMRISRLWRGAGLRPHLMFQSEEMSLPPNDPACQIIAFKYVGEFSDGLVPKRLTMRSVMDSAYLQRIGCPENSCVLASGDAEEDEVA
eukprot:TRINITY_DN51245_c0_g1_i1.p1 TRINITY_DN51245_c0_g1~~TRINITY_DN51245_c0_g1_i1.p1  ORF type:complete len:338 (-),score=72.63 TRINITY_DN51245_c0_g1_i1:75-1088(-)